MTNEQLATDLRNAARGCVANAQEETTRGAMFESWAERLVNGTDATPWAFPVGTADHPAEDWYCATWHDLTGRRNKPHYQHTGIDLNGDWGGRGNVDIGQPVFAVADGEVVSVGFSDRYRGGVVLKVDHFGVPLYVRYWHLHGPQPLFSVGDWVTNGEIIGTIDKYPGGYAHCHFDMAWQPFEHNWWWKYHLSVEWANPVYILKTHLDPARVDAMLMKGVQ